MKKIDLTGQRFGSWLVLCQSEKKTMTGHLKWSCQCDCGKITDVPRANLQSGASKGCSDCQGKSREKHGQARREQQSGSYKSWAKMMNRAYHKPKDNYLIFGITVCKKWQTFSGFYADMGDRPKGMTLERLDNNGNYEPDNCVWATRKQQAQNRGH